MIKKIKNLLYFLVVCMFIGVVSVVGINAHVSKVGREYILSSDEASILDDVDAILVLGCQVKDDGRPSIMLADRIQMGIELYQLGASDKIIMSGDHGREEYDEVNTMKQVAKDAGIDSSDIFMDHAGFSTYESLYRAKEIFQAKKIIIVTQEYHLLRALYVAEQLGLEAYGVASDYHTYAGQAYRDFREVLARVKDFVYTLFKPEPTFLGETIPVSGNGDVTNDK